MQLMKCLLLLALGAPLAAAFMAPLSASSSLLRGNVPLSAVKPQAQDALTLSAFKGT
jgi:hypothetical protein